MIIQSHRPSFYDDKTNITRSEEPSKEYLSEQDKQDIEELASRGISLKGLEIKSIPQILFGE